MRKLLALLLLLVVSPAFAQEYTPGPYVPPPPPLVDAETPNIVYTTVNPPPPGTQWVWTGFINSNTTGGGLSGGNIPAYNPSNGTFYFGYSQGTVTYRLSDSIDLPDPKTQINGFKYSWEYFNQDMARGSLTGNLQLLGLNNSILESYNFTMPKPTVGWTLQSGQIDFNMPYDGADVTGIQLSFSGKDDRFWAGYYGPQIRGMDVSLLYTSGGAPPPPDYPYWNTLTGEGGIFTLTESTTVRYGAQGTYLYATFQPGTYACTNGDWGNDPIGGVVKSCDAGSSSPPATTVDCNADPLNLQCIITASSPSSRESTGSADNTSATSTDGTTVASVDGSQPSSTVSESTSSTQETTQETAAATADPVAKETQTVLAASAATATESMKSETTEKQLADSIDKDLLSLVLSIVEATSVQQGGSDSSGSSSGSTSSSSASISVAGIDANNQSQSGGSEVSGAEIAATAAVEETFSTGRSQAAASVAAAEQGVETAYQASVDTVAFVQTQAAESAFAKDAIPTFVDTPVGTVDMSSIANGSDPTSSSSFANLEAAGVLNNRVEEKSDAEKKADQIVAANKEQQDEINKNYMDADQSGIVAAMGAETDVNAYLRRMLSDAAVWYKPEDIYKGVVIKDNVRGSYFLEKGNTDLYKKLIEEQYK